MYLLTALVLVFAGPYLPTDRGRALPSAPISAPAVTQTLTKIAVYASRERCEEAARAQKGAAAWREQEIMEARIEVVMSCIPVDSREAVAP